MPDLTTTVLTLTVTGLAADSRLGGVLIRESLALVIAAAACCAMAAAAIFAFLPKQAD